VDVDIIMPHDKEAIAEYSARGLAKFKLNDYSGAIEYYTKIIEIDPNKASAYSNRGLSKDRSEDHSGAIKDLTKAIELEEIRSIRGAYYQSRGYAKKNIGDLEVLKN